MRDKGLLIVISGPSGVGKGTIIKRFIDDPDLKLAFSVSMTTRNKREGEVEGVNYYYVTREQFEKTIEEGGLLEWTEFVGNYYGTPLAAVEKLRNEGKNVLLEIEVDGCQQVKKKVPDALTIFIVPPSLKELENRIRGRKTEAEEIVQQRLAKAEKELEKTNQYRYVVCNDDVDLAADIIRVIIRHHMEKEF
jgi:guanylate kinase